MPPGTNKPEGPCRVDLVALMARGDLSCGVTVRDNDGTGQVFLLLPAISPDLAVAAASASMFWVRGGILLSVREVR